MPVWVNGHPAFYLANGGSHWLVSKFLLDSARLAIAIKVMAHSEISRALMHCIGPHGPLTQKSDNRCLENALARYTAGSVSRHSALWDTDNDH